LNFYSHFTNNGAAELSKAPLLPVTEKYNPNRDFFRVRMRSTSAASQDWEVLQAVVGFAFTIQQEFFKLRRDTSAMLSTLAQQQLASVQNGYPAALQRIVATAHNLTEASGAAIALGDEQAMVCVARSGASSPPLGSRFDSRFGLGGECVRTHESVICMNAAADPRVDYNACTALGIRSMVYRPLFAQNKLIGVLAVFSSRAQHFSYRDLNCLRWTDDLIAEAIRTHNNAQVGVGALIRDAFVPEVLPQPLTHAPVAPGDIPSVPAPTSPPPQASPRLLNDAPAIIEAPAVVKDLPPPKPEPTFVGRVVDESVADEESVPSFEIKEEQYESPVPMLVAAIMVLAFLVVVGLMSYLRLAPKPKLAATPPQTHQVTTPARETETITPTPEPNNVAATKTPDFVPETTPPPKQEEGLPAGFEFRSEPSKAVLDIALAQRVTYQGFAIKNPDRLYFDLHGVDLVGPKGSSMDVKDGLVSRIRVSLHSGNLTRIVFDLHKAVDYDAVQTENPRRLRIELRPKAAAPSTTPPTVLAPAENITIVIDPGHGGRDTGAISAGGLREKDVTLDLAQRLGSLLEQRLGARVVYTRTSDEFLPLAKRVAIANDAHADLLISIHGNSSSFHSVRGLETYYFRNPQEALVHASDTSQSNSQGDGDPDAARNFAADVHNALLHGLNDGNQTTRNRGLKTAPFVVLKEAHMPAVLAEVAFISSRKDAQRLASSAYRDKVAKALYQGIRNHVARRDARILSATNLRSASSVAAR
jgi:N-acetylmuramoyl-L-alanine amidase